MCVSQCAEDDAEVTLTATPLMFARVSSATTRSTVGANLCVSTANTGTATDTGNAAATQATSSTRRSTASQSARVDAPTVFAISLAAVLRMKF